MSTPPGTAVPGGPASGPVNDPANGPVHGLGRRAARGAAVTGLGQAVRMVVQVASVAVLARLLSPDDYGLMAMVVVVVGVGEILRDFGLSHAAVQARELTRAQQETLFWVNAAIGVVLGTALWFGAPLVADLYGAPELVDIARWLALTFVLNGCATQYRADLLRRLRFGAVAVVETLAPVVALGAAVGLALGGAGYHALVAQSLTHSGTLLVAFGVAARWLPRLPRRGTPVRGLLGFGSRLAVTQLVSYASNNVDTVVIGLRLGATPLGLYNRAFHLLMTPLAQVRAPATTVATPVLARLQDDERRFGEVVRRGQLVLGYTLVLGLGVVVAAPDAVVDVLLGAEWAEAAPLLRLLALAGAFQTLSYVGYWVYLARGLGSDLLRYTLLTSAIKVACVLVGSHWGLVGVAAGYAIAPGLAWPLSLWWLSRVTPLPTRALVAGASRILACTSLAGGGAALVAAALASAPSLARLAAATGTLLAVAALLALCVPRVRADLVDVLTFVRAARRERAR